MDLMEPKKSNGKRMRRVQVASRKEKGGKAYKGGGILEGKSDVWKNR